MDYYQSSHYFDKIVQKHLEDISNRQIEIDDLLTEAENEDEAINILRKVLERCHEKNIKLACHKLLARPEFDFAGTHIGGQTDTV